MAVAELTLIDNMIAAFRAVPVKQGNRVVREFVRGQPPEEKQLAGVPAISIDLMDGGDERNLTSDSNIATVPIEIVAWIGGSGGDSDKRSAIALLNDCLKALETKATTIYPGAGVLSTDFTVSSLSILWHYGATGARKIVTYEMTWPRDTR